MRLHILVGTILFAVTCSGAHAKSVNPKHLEKMQPPVEYRLDADVSVQGYNILYTIRAGRYLHTHKDRRGGRYFLGAGNCMHLDIRTPRMTGMDDWTCGIYIPQDPARGASFFRIRGENPTHAEMGPVINGIVRYGNGSFDWPDKAESMELREKLLLVAQ